MTQYKCCCCIPIRAGVFLIALITAIVYIGLTIYQFIKGPSSVTFGSTGTEDLQYIKISYYISVTVSIIVSLASLFGIVGCIAQNRKMISLFRIIYWTVTILEFVGSAATIIIAAVNRNTGVDACLKAYPEETAESCGVLYRNGLLIISGIVLVINFIQFYFASAISTYATRLRRTNMHEKLRNLEDFPEPPNKTEFF